MTTETPKPSPEPRPVGPAMSRRRVLQSTALAGAATAVTGFPFVHAQAPVTLRIAGTGVNAYNQIAEKALEDLGINVTYTVLTSDDVVRRAVTQPTSFDLLDVEYWMIAKIVPAGTLLGMDTRRIGLFDQIVPIFTRGEMPDGTKMADQGTAPFKVSFLEQEGGRAFASDATEFMTAIPTVYNADTLGIRPDLIGRPI